VQLFKSTFMFKICLVFAAAIIFVACGNNPSTDRKDGFSDVAKTPEDSMFQVVMNGHDTAMAQMGKLSRYRKQVQQDLDSLQKLKSTSARSLHATYSDLYTSLKGAEDGMNRWMDEFVIDTAQDDIPTRMKYLAYEQVRVERVRDSIFSALSRADSLLRKK
jgi:hypothetical protein